MQPIMSRFLSVLLSYSQKMLKRHSEINQMIYLLLTNSREGKEKRKFCVMQQCKPRSILFFKNFRYDWKNFENVRTGKYKMKFLLQCRVHMFLDTIYL